MVARLLLAVAVVLCLMGQEGAATEEGLYTLNGAHLESSLPLDTKAEPMPVRPIGKENSNLVCAVAGEDVSGRDQAARASVCIRDRDDGRTDAKAGEERYHESYNRVRVVRL